MRAAHAAIVAAALIQMWTPPLRVIDAGPVSGVREPLVVTARSQDEWAAAWRAHAPAAPPATVDWSTEMVVGVFAGTKPTGGYRVEILGYRIDGVRIVVGYREIAPPRDAIAAQVVTSPYAVVAIPRQAGEVTFERV